MGVEQSSPRGTASADQPGDIAPSTPASFTHDLALLADAPDAEAAIGALGASGRTLNQLLRAADIERATCWFGTVFDTRPADDDIAAFCAGARERKTWPDYTLEPYAKGKNFRPEHAARILALRASPPSAHVIVTLGGPATFALLGPSNITQWRGTLTRLPTGQWVMPTYAPLSVMRQWKLFATCAHDLAKAKRVAAAPNAVRLLEPNIGIVTYPGAISELHAALRARDALCAVDIETSRGQIDTIAFGTDDIVAVVPLIDEAVPSRSFWPDTATEHAVVCAMRALLEDPAVPKVLQNGTYDAYWLWRMWGIKVSNYAHDTRLMHHALYPELPKSLQYLGSTYTLLAPWKHLRKAYDPDDNEKRDA